MAAPCLFYVGWARCNIGQRLPNLLGANVRTKASARSYPTGISLRCLNAKPSKQTRTLSSPDNILFLMTERRKHQSKRLRDGVLTRAASTHLLAAKTCSRQRIVQNEPYSSATYTCRPHDVANPHPLSQDKICLYSIFTHMQANAEPEPSLIGRRTLGIIVMRDGGSHLQGLAGYQKTSRTEKELTIGLIYSTNRLQATGGF